MTFSISILNERSDDVWPVGEVVFGDYRETFPLDTSYWSADQYVRNWKDACRQLVRGDEKQTEVLVTGIENPAASAGFMCFVLFRESDTVFIQQRMVFYVRLTQPFDESRPAKGLEGRRTHTEDGQEISEWSVGLDEVKSFLAGLMQGSRDRDKDIRA